MIIILFLGNSFFSGKFAADPTAVQIDNINIVSLYNGIFDDLLVSRNINQDLAIKEFDIDTIMHAAFNGTIFAGNVEFSASSVSSFLVKRRIKGSFDDWLPLFQVPVQGNPDKFKFERYDKYPASQTNYEYCVIPVLNGIEGNYNINSIFVEFDGIFIVSKDKVFGSIMDNEFQPKRNKPSAIVNTIESKYPFFVSHSKNNYYTGSVSATFMEFDYETCQWKLEHGYEYRKKLLDYLLDGDTKILKIGETGETFLIMVNETSEERLKDTDKVTTTFQFTEVGDSKSVWDLYDNNFLDNNINVLFMPRR